MMNAIKVHFKFTVYLSAIPHFVTLHPFDQLVEVHFDVSLKCRAVGGDNLDYQWTHNGIIITPNYHYIVKGSDLLIVSTTFLDAGQYQCIATNKNGSVASNYANIIVSHDGKLYLKCKVHAAYMPQAA